MKQIYITKFALTRGTLEYEADERHIGADMVMIATSKGETAFFERNDWHETKAEAIEQAELMREAELKRLNKRIGKIKNMRFE